MELYLIVLLPISSVFLLCMLVLLILFERVKRQTVHMISGGYYFIQKGDTYLGIPPEYVEEVSGMNTKMSDADAPIPVIVLVVVFYVVGFLIALYIRMSKIVLIRKIKETGRVISLSQTLITMLMQQLQEQQRQQISPATGLPPPPPYTIRPPTPPPILPDELPPPYVEPPPYSK